MNQNFIKFSAFVMGLSMFASCQKDLTNSKPEVTRNVKSPQFPERPDLTYVPDYESYQLPADKARVKVAAMLEEFSGGNSLQTRSETNISVAEAVWNIEALTNKKTSRATWQYEQIDVTTSFIPLETVTVNGVKQVSMQEVASKFTNSVSSVQQTVSNNPYPSNIKQSIYTDVIPTVSNNGTIVLALSVGVGSNPSGCITCPPATLPTPRGCLTSDSWLAGFRAGKCNNNPNSNLSGVGSDATDVLEGYIYSVARHRCLSTGSMDGVTPGGIFDTPINLVPRFNYEIGGSNYRPDAQQQPSYKKRYLYSSSGSDPEGYVNCLSQSDLFYFGEGAIALIVNDKANYPNIWQTKSYLNCDVRYEAVSTFNPNLFHELNFTICDFM